MIYTPVCIPTLNRYDHLRRCLESLSRCSGAEQTEVYVALDYPPVDKWNKYAPGWEKNREFLHSCGDMGFKKLHLIERTTNYGIWFNPAGKPTNLGSLIDEYIRGKYECWITTEDDNVFAPAFLEYMNKGYELFKDDPEVVCISGYRFYFPIKYGNNTFFRQVVDYAPWGCMHVGLHKFPFLDYHWFRQHLSISVLFRLWHRFGMGAVCDYFAHLSKQGNVIPIDNHYWAYMQIMGYEQITPVKNLVMNIGLDGSGATQHDCNGEDWADASNNPLSTDEHFEFIGTGYEYFDENNKIYYRGKYWMTEWQYFCRACKKALKWIIKG